MRALLLYFLLAFTILLLSGTEATPWTLAAVHVQVQVVDLLPAIRTAVDQGLEAVSYTHLRAHET